MQQFDELKAYVGFGDDDIERLRALRPHVQPSIVDIANRFYDVVLRFPAAAAVFQDMAQVERLKHSLRAWVEQLLTGPYDVAYYELRRRIGQAHVRVGLPSQYMFTAMNRLMEDLHRIAANAFPHDVGAFGESLRRITDIELAIMLGTYIDAREQNSLQSLRDLLISHLPTTVLLVDKQGRVAASTSPRNDLFTGRDLVGLTVFEALKPELMSRAQLQDYLARAVDTEREIVVPLVDVVLPSGTRTLRVTIIPLLHPLADALVHIEDLTEVISAEARAKQAEHLAKLGVMAASVAHEIRNPLAGISGTVQVIANSLAASDGRRDALGKVQEQIARLGALVGDLLHFSRPISALCRPLDLAVVANAVVAQAQSGESGAARVEGDGEAVGDAGMLGQVLLNLVQNAWQAGAQQVVVRLADGAVDVDDDGPGVAEDMRARVFEPFFTTKVRGTGLGLSIARKMVEAMNGSLQLSTSPQGGASFRIRLPLARDDDAHAVSTP